MDKEERKRKMAQAWCDFQERMMLSNSGCGPMVLAAVVLVCVWLMWGCKSVEYVAVPQQHTDTLIITKHQRDSIFLKDSTHVSEKGDTVRIEHWRTQFVKKEVHDTTYIANHDTIPAPYPVEVVKEVEKDLSWWQLTKMHIGGVVLWLIGIAAVVLIGKFVIKRYLP
jgi:hypothetical protein